MKTLAIFLSVFFVVTVQAGEPIIVETDNGIIVEYIGTPEGEKPGIKSLVDELTKEQRQEIKQQAREAIDRLQRKIAEAEWQIQEERNKPRPVDK